ncbi:MAG: AGE family epimerase/isomerase [Eubacteriales bacterium]|nr:AGE family epimerase/isomerase [Eubacteriales bacterium]
MDLKQEVREHLQNKLIPFWAALRDEANGGFTGYVGFDLQKDETAPKGCILNSRILWFFSRAYQMLKQPPLLELARHAYAFMDRFEDTEYGGLYWAVTYDGKPLDTAKHTYAQAFAVYGLAAYAQASGNPEALQKAMGLYTLIETRMADENGYGEAFDRVFHPEINGKLSDNPKLTGRGVIAQKTMNTLLHLLEAYTLLYEVGRDPRVLSSLRALLLMLRLKVYNREANRLEVFFDSGMRSLFDMQSYGHDIEASWLIDLAARVAQTPEERAETERLTTELARDVLKRAFRDGSLLNERVEDEDDDTRVWWVQAETMVGLANLWQKTGEAEWLEAMQAEWRYIRTRLADPREGGEWYWCLDAEGTPCPRPIVEPWKCPYHNGRMCMELVERL